MANMESCNAHAAAVNSIRPQLPEKEKLLRLAALYKVFSDYTRVHLLWALEGGELCVCGLAELLGMSMSAVSHQLRVLRQSNLISSRRDGKNRYYFLADDHVKGILLQGFSHVNE